jgi:hypothetical protein
VSCTSRDAAFRAPNGQIKLRQKPRTNPDADYGIQVSIHPAAGAHAGHTAPCVACPLSRG